MARKITGINNIPTNFDENKQAETHNITNWCIKLGISLLDSKYFEDNNQYTIQEFETLVPRDIKVPLVSASKDEILLNSVIESFYEDKKQLDNYKKSTDEYNKEIKKLMSELNKTEFETDKGLVAKITVQNRESFNENKLISKLKELNGTSAIKTKEYVDMDVLEDLIYNGKINASELTSCKVSKQVVTLKVSERK